MSAILTAAMSEATSLATQYPLIFIYKIRNQSLYSVDVVLVILQVKKALRSLVENRASLYTAQLVLEYSPNRLSSDCSLQLSF